MDAQILARIRVCIEGWCENAYDERELLEALEAHASKLQDCEDTIDRADEHTAMIMERLEAAEAKLHEIEQQAEGATEYVLSQLNAALRHDLERAMDGRNAEANARLAAEAKLDALNQRNGKLIHDTGKGCSVCGDTPVVNVPGGSGTYWLCGSCVAERLDESRERQYRLEECNALLDDYEARIKRLEGELDAFSSGLGSARKLCREIEFFLRGRPGEASLLRAKIQKAIDREFVVETSVQNANPLRACLDPTCDKPHPSE